MVEVVVELCVCKCEVGDGAGAKSHKTERDSSVLGMPHKNVIGVMVRGGSIVWLRGVVVVVRLCVCKHKVGEGAGGQIPHIQV